MPVFIKQKETEALRGKPQKHVEKMSMLKEPKNTVITLTCLAALLDNKHQQQQQNNN